MLTHADRALTVADLVSALLDFPLDTPCGIALVAPEGVTADLVPFGIGGVDCALSGDGRVTTVWLITAATELAAPPGAEWICPTCETTRYVRNGDELPWCCR